MTDFEFESLVLSLAHKIRLSIRRLQVLRHQLNQFRALISDSDVYTLWHALEAQTLKLKSYIGTSTNFGKS